MPSGDNGKSGILVNLEEFFKVDIQIAVGNLKVHSQTLGKQENQRRVGKGKRNRTETRPYSLKIQTANRNSRTTLETRIARRYI